MKAHNRQGTKNNKQYWNFFIIPLIRPLMMQQLVGVYDESVKH